MPKSAQRQFLVKVARISGYFMTKSGGNISADTNKVYDGGRTEPDVVAAPPEADNITVSRAYDPYLDGPVLSKLRRQVGRYRDTLSVTDTDEDLAPIGQPRVYPQALLVSVNEPEADASSGDVATYELEFAVGAWR